LPSNDGNSKHYEITIDCETSKIMHYEKDKGNKKLIVIDNAEESTETLIINELNAVRKELEKGFSAI